MFELYPRQWVIPKGLISMAYAVSPEDLLQKQLDTKCYWTENQNQEFWLGGYQKNLGKKNDKDLENRKKGMDIRNIFNNSQ